VHQAFGPGVDDPGEGGGLLGVVSVELVDGLDHLGEKVGVELLLAEHIVCRDAGLAGVEEAPKPAQSERPQHQNLLKKKEGSEVRFFSFFFFLNQGELTYTILLAAVLTLAEPSTNTGLQKKKRKRYYSCVRLLWEKMLIKKKSA
jgi:hypothetical protein